WSVWRSPRCTSLQRSAAKAWRRMRVRTRNAATRTTLTIVSSMSEFDVVGVGLNATDTLLIVPHFPAYAGKVPFEEEHLSPGGQVASALVACARLGLRTKYIGAVGDDLRGQIQVESLQGTGINLDHVLVRKGCPNQSAYIIIDRSTGERTVLWRRDECLKV